MWEGDIAPFLDLFKQRLWSLLRSIIEEIVAKHGNDEKKQECIECGRACAIDNSGNFITNDLAWSATNRTNTLIQPDQLCLFPIGCHTTHLVSWCLHRWHSRFEVTSTILFLFRSLSTMLAWVQLHPSIYDQRFVKKYSGLSKKVYNSFLGKPFWKSWIESGFLNVYW